jgi:hypothetical protein
MLPAAPPSAPPAALSDGDSDFEQVGRRKRRQLASAAAMAAAVPSGSEGSDWEVSEGLEEGGAATPTRAGPGCCADEDGAPEQQPAEAVLSLQAAVAELTARIVEQFCLNGAQASVVGHVADWLPQLMQDLAARQQKGPGSRRGRGQMLAKPAVATPAAGGSNSANGATGVSSSSRPPVCLIHGPFGSGKSSLLVALIHLLTGLPQLLVSLSALRGAAGMAGANVGA